MIVLEVACGDWCDWVTAGAPSLSDWLVASAGMCFLFQVSSKGV